MTFASTPIHAVALSFLLPAATLLLPAQTAQQSAPAATPSSPGAAPAPSPRLPASRNNLFLDAAHGGADDGARIGDRILEKDLTLSLVARIRAQLSTQENLNLVLTRDPDAGDPALDTQPPAPSIDSRAGLANHTHAGACVLLHATAAGSGVHIVTSQLDPPDPSAPVTSATPWATAQASYVRQSLRLANQVGLSLLRAGIPVYLTHASVRPLDSLTCPAIAIEIAPPHASSDPSSIDDPSYQQRISTAVASALVAWRNRPVPPPATATPPPQSAPPASGAPILTPVPARPRQPASAPQIQPSAPIIRRPPPPPATEPQPITPPQGAGEARP